MSEKLFLDDISTGASGDIQQATSLARAMVTQFGMSDRLGPISYDSVSYTHLDVYKRQAKNNTLLNFPLPMAVFSLNDSKIGRAHV